MNTTGDAVAAITAFNLTSNNMSIGHYEAYGNALATAYAGNPYGYRGYYTDSETGFAYLRARYYDPATQRFTQEDTYWGDNLQRNLYAYCSGNPVMYTDPSGHYKQVQQGSKGDDVRTLQKLLNAHGANLAVDGDFGPMTKAAVVAYQKANGLAVDGIVGSQTWGSLTRGQNTDKMISVNNTPSTLEDCFQVSNESSDPIEIFISGNTINIKAYVSISGDSEVAKRIKSAIESYWSGEFSVFNYEITLNTTVVNLFDDKERIFSKSRKFINVRYYETAGISHAYRFPTWKKSNSAVIRLYEGDIRSGSKHKFTNSEFDWIAAHEFGHVIGQKDLYLPFLSKKKEKLYQ